MSGLTTKIRGIQIQDNTIKNQQIASDAAIELSKLEKQVLTADGNTQLSFDWNVGNHKITNVSDPTNAQDVATKNYVDQSVASLGNNFEWQNSVISATILTPPSSPSIGDRYLINGVGTGAWAGHSNEIAEWNGTSWIFTTATTGTYIASDAETDGIYYFGGSSWTKKDFENTTAGVGLTKVGNQISAVAGTGITVNGGISVNFFKERFQLTTGQTSVTLLNIPATNSTLVFYNGQLMDEGLSNDYSITGAVITLNFVAVDSNDKLVIWYLR